MFINIIDILHLVDGYKINILYSLADMISKTSTSIIVNDYNERLLAEVSNMDLQSAQLSMCMIKYIDEYQKENANITTKCRKFIENIRRRFMINIPENKTTLEHELLQKILPLDFDKMYISQTIENDPMLSTSIKQFTMICILFTDIVDYTALAKKYNDQIIFQLLNTVYKKFDKIIKKYAHLQKIETIGDAYMVVGDIYRNSSNHTIVVKEMILFAQDILKEIKAIKTPDDKPLSIRVGINMGTVSVGFLGTEIPRLCIVGNAVNVAARLQSTADVDTIQFSHHIYEQLGDDLNIEITKKENVFLKNLGSITAYNIS